MVKDAVEHMEAAIKELEDKVNAGHIDALVGESVIESIKITHERLSRLEALLGRKSEST